MELHLSCTNPLRCFFIYFFLPNLLACPEAGCPGGHYYLDEAAWRFHGTSGSQDTKYLLANTTTLQQTDRPNRKLTQKYLGFHQNLTVSIQGIFYDFQTQFCEVFTPTTSSSSQNISTQPTNTQILLQSFWAPKLCPEIFFISIPFLFFFFDISIMLRKAMIKPYSEWWLNCLDYSIEIPHSRNVTTTWLCTVWYKTKGPHLIQN